MLLERQVIKMDGSAAKNEKLFHAVDSGTKVAIPIIAALKPEVGLALVAVQAAVDVAHSRVCAHEHGQTNEPAKHSERKEEANLTSQPAEVANKSEQQNGLQTQQQNQQQEEPGLGMNA